MNVRRLSDAGIRNLGLLFSPMGLPLVVKADAGPPTTSILVRGGPGTGKTTMSLAMAHAIAGENGGAVLFLTTEFSPAEIVAKADLLGLPEASVLGWPRRAEARQGSILVQHLTATDTAEADDATSISADQKRRAMEATWSMLQVKDLPPTLIRAVVIDAFSLPDAEENEGKLRSDLVPFIQALERGGVSTVLVEEALAGGPDWLAFVTDIVLELSFQADAETGELHRRIVCKKSRYAQAIPGPHDYGLELFRKRPSVFPDPLLALGSSSPAAAAVPKERRAALFIPLDEDGNAVLVRNGALLLNAFDRAGGRLTHAFGSTPDVARVVWQCGPVSTLTIDRRHARLHESAGPYAICDAILGMLELGKGNAVEIHNIGTLAASSRYRNGLPRVLDALRRRGCLVLVHGVSTELAPFGPFADVDAEQQNRGSLRVSPGLVCPVTVHLPSLELLTSVVRGGPFDAMPGAEEGAFLQELLDAVRASESARARGDMQAALDSLSMGWREWGLAAWDPWIATAYFLISILSRRLGVKNDPRLTYILARIQDPNFPVPSPGVGDLFEQFGSHGALHGPLAWAFAVMGNEPAAAYWCLHAFERNEATGDMNRSLWIALQAIRTLNPRALEVLIALATEEQVGALFIGFALRALVTRQRAAEIDELVTRYVQTHPMPPFMERRLRAEPLLAARDAALRAKARDELLSLANLPDIPSLHRAEVFHNIGFAYEKGGDLVEARGWYSRANQENAGLTLAAEALARFDKSQVLDATRERTEQAKHGDTPGEGAADDEENIY